MSQRNKKRVLLITYYFPPSGGAGVQRSLKFVKYLPQFGWEPVVLTVRDADYPARDESLLQEIPRDTKVYRTFIPEPYKIYRKVTGRKTDEAVDIATLTRSAQEKRKLSERVSEWVRSCFFIPDARIGWLPFALACGMKIIRQETIEVIYSSAPPYTCHLIGFWLKKITGKPWVADFRDSWVGWLSAPRRPVLPAKLDRYLERSVLKWADKILTVSKGVAQDLGSRNPNLMDSRWHLLPNGYDGADFEGVQAFPSNNKFVITYTGSLYGHRNPYYFLQAIAELMAEAEDLRQYLQLTFVGRMGRSIEDMLRDSRFEGLVKIVPYVSHRESLQYLLSSDVLLLIIDDAPANKGILTGKLFEYLGARKPLLALAPEGEAAELIREVKAGVVAHPANVEEVKQALRHYYQNWKDHTLSSEEMDVDKIQAFDRRELARRLADILDRVVSHAFNHRSLNK